MPATEAKRLLAIGRQKEEVARSEDPVARKSIDGTLRYLRQGRFKEMLTAIEGKITPGRHENLKQAYLGLAGMVRVAYLQQPSTHDVQLFEDLAKDLRGRLGLLKATGTTWGHIWTVHMPQFLRRWGSIWPFVCHGVEGKHRVFKADLRLSAGNQVNSKGLVGFAHTLDKDRIRWALLGQNHLDRGLAGVSRLKDDMSRYATFKETLQAQVYPQPSFFNTFVIFF